jgi:hypothetical protein
VQDDWPKFIAYKTSEEGAEVSRRNQQNAQKKEYHHKTGSGGYRTGIPKWEKMEEELLAKGIAPKSLDWPE